MSVELLVAIWVISGLAGLVIGLDRGRPGEGLALGFLFGPTGAILAGLLRPSADVLARERLAVELRYAALTDTGGKPADSRALTRRAKETPHFWLVVVGTIIVGWIAITWVMVHVR